MSKRQNQLWVKRNELLEDAGMSEEGMHSDFMYLLGKGYISVPGPGPIDQLQYIPYAHMKITAAGNDYLEELAQEPKQAEAQKTLLSVPGNHNKFHNVSVGGGVDVPGENNAFTKTSIGHIPRSNEHKLLWWFMSIVAGVIVLLIGVYVLGVGK